MTTAATAAASALICALLITLTPTPACGVQYDQSTADKGAVYVIHDNDRPPRSTTAQAYHIHRPTPCIKTGILTPLPEGYRVKP